MAAIATLKQVLNQFDLCFLTSRNVFECCYEFQATRNGTRSVNNITDLEKQSKQSSVHELDLEKA